MLFRKKDGIIVLHHLSQAAIISYNLCERYRDDKTWKVYMPPRYQQIALVNFYRPCWSAHERGPPERKRKGPITLKYIFPISCSKKWGIKPVNWVPAVFLGINLLSDRLYSNSLQHWDPSQVGWNPIICPKKVLDRSWTENTGSYMGKSYICGIRFISGYFFLLFWNKFYRRIVWPIVDFNLNEN